MIDDPHAHGSLGELVDRLIYAARRFVRPVLYGKSKQRQRPTNNFQSCTNTTISRVGLKNHPMIHLRFVRVIKLRCGQINLEI